MRSSTGTLVIASGSEAMKALIDRIKDDDGATTPIAEDATWKARREAAGENAAGWAMVNLKRLREIDPERYASDKIDPGALFLFGPWIKATRTADWASLSLTWTDGSAGRRAGAGET